MAWAQKLIGHKWVSNLGNDTKKSTKVHYILCLMLILEKRSIGVKIYQNSFFTWIILNFSFLLNFSHKYCNIISLIWIWFHLVYFRLGKYKSGSGSLFAQSSMHQPLKIAKSDLKNKIHHKFLSCYNFMILLHIYWIAIAHTPCPPIRPNPLIPKAVWKDASF